MLLILHVRCHPLLRQKFPHTLAKDSTCSLCQQECQYATFFSIKCTNVANTGSEGAFERLKSGYCCAFYAQRVHMTKFLCHKEQVESF